MPSVTASCILKWMSEPQRLVFRPVRPDEYDVAEEFKRATSLAVTGDAGEFARMFPPAKPFINHLKRLQEPDVAAVAFALVDNDPVGYIEVGTRRNDPERGFIFNLYLKPEWRGKKLGDQLEDYALAWCRKRGFRQVRLRTVAANGKAMAFYRHLGYVYSEESENGMVFLIKTLTDSGRAD